MNTITCTNCGVEIEIDKALEGQIEARVLAAERHKHADELEKVRGEAAAAARKSTEAAMKLAQSEAQTELEIAKKQLEAEILSVQKKAAAENELKLKASQEDAEAEKKASAQLRAQLGEMMQELRTAKDARANAELEAAKKVAAETDKIREEAGKQADERQRLNLAAKEKTITDLQKALDDAQRKAAQGSQQLQGEVLELDLEEALAKNFRDDDINPVAKGVNGADISHTVKSPGGTTCGTILWEIKRTKNWTDSWIPKLKTDLRAAKANVPVIITEVMPKQIDSDMGQLDGVWICKPGLAIILGALLRKSLIDVGRQKALSANQGDKATALYSFVTSHEFSQQIEAMVETYQEMTAQVTRERVVYEKQWALREKQANKLLLGTANIIGSMQGHVGQASMPKIKGLELDDDDSLDITDEPASQPTLL